MNNNANKKILTVSFVLAGVLVSFVLYTLLNTFSASSALIAQFMANEIVSQVLLVAVGMVTFAVLQFNPKVVNFTDEVVVELKKVVWPSRKDTIAMTIVVCVMLVIAAIVFGLLDFVSGYLIKLLIK